MRLEVQSLRLLRLTLFEKGRFGNGATDSRQSTLSTKAHFRFSRTKNHLVIVVMIMDTGSLAESVESRLEQSITAGRKDTSGLVKAIDRGSHLVLSLFIIEYVRFAESTGVLGS